jgi:hypothetical protein
LINELFDWEIPEDTFSRFLLVGRVHSEKRFPFSNTFYLVLRTVKVLQVSYVQRVVEVSMRECSDLFLPEFSWQIRHWWTPKLVAQLLGALFQENLDYQPLEQAASLRFWPQESKILSAAYK